MWEQGCVLQFIESTITAPPLQPSPASTLSVFESKPSLCAIPRALYSSYSVLAEVLLRRAAQEARAAPALLLLLLLLIARASPQSSTLQDADE